VNLAGKSNSRYLKAFPRLYSGRRRRARRRGAGVRAALSQTAASELPIEDYRKLRPISVVGVAAAPTITSKTTDVGRSCQGKSGHQRLFRLMHQADEPQSGPDAHRVNPTALSRQVSGSWSGIRVRTLQLVSTRNLNPVGTGHFQMAVAYQEDGYAGTLHDVSSGATAPASSWRRAMSLSPRSRPTLGWPPCSALPEQPSRWWFWPVVIAAVLVMASVVTLLLGHNIPTYR
jgi:hypothetical protein